MTPSVSLPSLLACLLCVTVLSGCAESEAPEPEPDVPLPEPASLAAPTWTPGDTWTYVDDHGVWRNITVEAVEEHRGRSTYRLVLEENEADQFGVSTSTAWVDRDTLGFVAFQEGEFSGAFDPPMGQIFPMVNRTYANDARLSSGYETTVQAKYHVGGWTEVTTRAGSFDAVEIRTDDEGSSQSINHGWFAPSVGNFVLQQEDDGNRFQLVAWQYAAAP